MTIIRHIGRTLMLLLLLCGLGSCIYDKDAEEPEPVATGRVLSLDVTIPSMQAGEAGIDGNGYETGVDFENYIDLSSGGLRIYIFDSVGRFVTRLVPLGDITAGKSGEKDTYTVTGVLPDDFPTTSTFKVAVLANWPVFNDDLTPGVSTVDDLCGAAWAQFDRLTDFHLSADNTIPFFGIREYVGVTVKPGETTMLEGDVSLLRAMAKVEIIIDSEVVSLSSAAIRGFNAKGYCAPAGVYSQADYDHGGQWSQDYVKTLHLPGGANDAGQGATALPLYCKNRRDGSRRETWVCYVPEYRNTANADGSANYKSHLELLFDYQGKTDMPSNVYFVDYSDGKPVDGSDFDIHRNNCYRFTVSVGLAGLIINVNKWENAYDNDFIFM